MRDNVDEAEKLVGSCTTSYFISTGFTLRFSNVFACVLVSL